MAKPTKQPETPAQAYTRALENFAHHIAAITFEPERARMGLTGAAYGAPELGEAIGNYTFKRDEYSARYKGMADATYSTPDIDAPDVDPSRFIIGNRYAAINEYTARCAPILAGLAARAADPRCKHGERLDDSGQSPYCHTCAAERAQARNWLQFALDVQVLGHARVLVVGASDRDHAFDVARTWLREHGYPNASIRGTARPASQNDIEAAERSQWG